MNIYFTASLAGKKQYEREYKAIVEYLVKYPKTTVQADHILSVSKTQVYAQTKQERLDYHKLLARRITEADIVVAETSYPSVSVGYEISLAIQQHKPTLILYCDQYPPVLLAYHDSEYLVCEQYTLGSLPHILDDFFRYVAGATDSRFTFFVSAKEASHLDQMSKKFRMPKSVYLRNLIDEDMGKKSR